jgi:hypothetical protein
MIKDLTGEAWHLSNNDVIVFRNLTIEMICEKKFLELNVE